MTRIAHLSDLHFGAHDQKIVDGTRAWLEDKRPDLIVISGDLTQRARSGQFRQASAYLNGLRAAGLPVLAIPGNHDIPLYDIFTRFLAPLRRYKRYIQTDLCPWFEDEEVAILGINTARSLTITDGRINHRQMDLIHERFGSVVPDKTRILVTHHPLFAMPIGNDNGLTEAVGRHRDAVSAAAKAGVHIALAGHFHRTYAEAADRMTEQSGRSLIIQAGTTTSTRLRNDEPQSFNWLHVRRNDEIELQVVAWNGVSFSRASHVEYRFRDGIWVKTDMLQDTAHRK